MGVYLCCTDGAVSKHLLDVPDIHVLFKQKCGKGMPEHMRGDMLADSGKLCIAVYHKSDGLIREFMVQSVDEKVSAGINIFLESFLV